MTDEVKSFVKILKERLRDDWDIVLAITGEEGVGKTTLGILLSQQIDKEFSLKKNVAFIPDEKQIMEGFNELPPLSAYLIDEAVKSLNKWSWFNSLQQAIIKMYAVARYQNKCTILCMPRFRDLTENFRNHRIKIHINVIDRGTAIAYIKDNDKDEDDPWHIDDNIKIKTKWFKNTPIIERTVEKRLEVERKLPNYLFDFNFADLDVATKEEYNNLRAEAKKVEAVIPQKPLNKREIKYAIHLRRAELKLRELGLCDADIAATLGITPGTVWEHKDDGELARLNPFSPELINNISIPPKKVKSDKITID